MGNIFGIDMSGFSYKVLAAMAYAVGAMFAFALFPTFNGGAQSVHLEARAEGSCETVAGQRFDRVVLLNGQTIAHPGGAIGADDGDIAVTLATAYSGNFVGKSGEETDPNKYDWSEGATVTPNCTLPTDLLTFGTAAGLTASETGTTTVDLLTADGTEVTATVLGTASSATAVGVTSITVSGANGSKSASMFNDNRDITNVVLGAIALVIGVGPIVVLGSIGMALLNTFGGSMGGAMKFLIATLGAVIAITLMGTIVDFISIAYDTVDRNRYTMYGQSVASLAGTIRQFWGLIFLASWVGLGGYYGWQGFQSIRGNRSAANPM